MSNNSRFAVSIHIMTILAHRAIEGATSDILARSVDTNPVVVRRLLSQLHHAGLITCQSGKCGGAHLGRAADDITLFDIYSAVDAGGPFAIPDKAGNKACFVSCQMKQVLIETFNQTQQAIAESLKRTSLADLLKSVQHASAA